jgi:hypothetical protein
VERQGRPTDIPNWIVMIEGLTPAAVVNAGNAVLTDAQLISHGSAPAITRDVYTLQYLHAASGIVG